MAAIVTDPPYGLMEGLGPFYLPLSQRLTALLRLASRRLRVGGRLVFLLPLPAAADAADALPPTLPTSRCLAVETVARQRLSRRMHRLLVTMVKLSEPATVDEGLEGAGAATRPEAHEWSPGEARPWEETGVSDEVKKLDTQNSRPLLGFYITQERMKFGQKYATRTPRHRLTSYSQHVARSLQVLVQQQRQREADRVPPAENPQLRTGAL